MVYLANIPNIEEILLGTEGWKQGEGNFYWGFVIY